MDESETHNVEEARHKSTQSLILLKVRNQTKLVFAVRCSYRQGILAGREHEQGLWGLKIFY